MSFCTRPSPPSPSSSSQQRPRRARICEEANTVRSFASDLSAAEHASLWYDQDDFRRMKSDRRQAAAQQHSNTERDCDDQDDCLRGLEKLPAPNTRTAARQKRATVVSIVQMSRQLKPIGGLHNSHNDESKERDEILRQFCLTKTSYSQHNAYYMAARDAVAVHGVDRSCYSKVSLAKQSVDYESTSTRRRSSSSSIRFSSVNPKMGQRRVPMAAQTA